MTDPGVDPAADTDDGVFDVRLDNDASIGDGHPFEMPAHDLAGRQIAGRGCKSGPACQKS